MRYRNNRELSLVRRLYGDTFLKTVVLEPQSTKLATMTWVVSQQEFGQLQQDVASVMGGAEMARLKKLWKD